MTAFYVEQVAPEPMRHEPSRCVVLAPDIAAARAYVERNRVTERGRGFIVRPATPREVEIAAALARRRAH